MKFTITQLADLAAHFEQRADEYRRASERAKTRSAKRECLTAAQVWREAAEIVRKTEISA